MFQEYNVVSFDFGSLYLTWLTPASNLIGNCASDSLLFWRLSGERESEDSLLFSRVNFDSAQSLVFRVFVFIKKRLVRDVAKYDFSHRTTHKSAMDSTTQSNKSKEVTSEGQQLGHERLSVLHNGEATFVIGHRSDDKLRSLMHTEATQHRRRNHEIAHWTHKKSNASRCTAVSAVSLTNRS